jgi:hypothetical protein
MGGNDVDLAASMAWATLPWGWCQSSIGAGAPLCAGLAATWKMELPLVPPHVGPLLLERLLLPRFGFGRGQELAGLDFPFQDLPGGLGVGYSLGVVQANLTCPTADFEGSPLCIGLPE